MDNGLRKKRLILSGLLFFAVAGFLGCEKPVCTGLDLQGDIDGVAWTFQSGLAVPGRYGYVMTLSDGLPDGNPCAFSAYDTGSYTLQVTVPVFSGTYPLNDAFDLTQVSFCAADALVCDIAVSGEVRIYSADLCEGTLSGSIEAELDETTSVSGCFTIHRCSLLECLLAEQEQEAENQDSRIQEDEWPR